MHWAIDRLEALKAGAKDVPPIVRTLRLGTLEDWGPGWARKRWAPEPAVLNGDGTMFGGYLAALADQILAFATMSVVGPAQGFRTANLNLQFFRVGRAQPLLIEGRVVSHTRSVIAVEATIACEQDGTLIAKASAQQWLQMLELPDTA